MARRPVGTGGQLTADDARVDELYALPLDQFVAARDALAKELRAAKDREGAAAVKALRKPSAAAAAVNHLARRSPGAVERLLALGDELRRAQRRALSGAAASELRDATRALRAAIDAAAADTGAAPSQHDRVVDTLFAAVTTDEHREDLVGGRLTTDLEPAPFGDVGGLTLLAGGDTGEAEPVEDDDAAVRAEAERREREEAERRSREREQRLAELRQAAADARAQADATEARAQAAERALREAEAAPD